MKITVLAIGKKHDAKLVSAIDEYTKRLQHYTKLEWKLVDAKVTPSMSNEDIKEKESAELAKHISEKDTVLLLDERGAELTSTELASKLQNYKNTSVRNIVFIIGGAYGVNNDLMQRADFTLSLSKFVLPHQLVRLVLIEQLYRAHIILADEQYHHH